MSINRRKSSLQDFQLFYEELVFITGNKRINRVRRTRKSAAASK